MNRQNQRYDPQRLPWDLEMQAKLGKSTVAVIGEDYFAFPAALNAILLGMNVRLFITGQTKPNDYALDFLLGGKNLSEEYQLILSQINPSVNVAQLPLTLETTADYGFLDGTNGIIDVTNNFTSKSVGLAFAKKRSIPFVSVFSNEGHSTLEIMAISEEVHTCEGKPKDLFLAWPMGAIAVQEIVKPLFGQEREKIGPIFIKTGYTFPFTKLTDTEEPRPIKHNSLSGKVALVVGTGGQGCFAVPVLAMLGYSPIYVDYKIVQEHNLSRQPLYWDSVGRHKAEVCTQKHNIMAGKGHASYLTGRFDENFGLDTKLDIVFGLTDNMFSRMLMSQYATRHGIPFISAGSDPEGAELCVYVPGKTTCYTHLFQGCIESAKVAEQEARIGCMDNPNPQIVMPNCFAGSMAAILSASVFNEGYAPFNGRMRYETGGVPTFHKLPWKEVCGCSPTNTLELRIGRPSTLPL